MNRKLLWTAGLCSALLLGISIAAAGSTAGVRVGGLPLFALCILAAFVIQWLMFIPAWFLQTEKYFDLTGSLTYITLALLCWLAAGVVDERSLLIGALVIVWAARLGSFLFQRILVAGEDRRFRSIKPDFLQFLMTWTLQGAWVSVTLGAGLAAMTTDAPAPLGVFAATGAALWLFGFIIEVAADTQKSRFNADPANQGRFINTGLWRWSRHPNYFGEIVLWVGIAVMAWPVLQGWQMVTLASPLFVTVLLTWISGVRMLERRADRKWGDDPAWRAYKKATPVLIPRPPKQPAG